MKNDKDEYYIAGGDTIKFKVTAIEFYGVKTQLYLSFVIFLILVNLEV